MNIDVLRYQVLALGEEIMFADPPMRKKKKGDLGAVAAGVGAGGVIGGGIGLAKKAGEFDKKYNTAIDTLKNQRAGRARGSRLKALLKLKNNAKSALPGGQMSDSMYRVLKGNILKPALKKYALPGALIGGTLAYGAKKIGDARRNG